jgi:hypothetical protein
VRKNILPPLIVVCLPVPLRLLSSDHLHEQPETPNSLPSAISAPPLLRTWMLSSDSCVVRNYFQTLTCPAFSHYSSLVVGMFSAYQTISRMSRADGSFPVGPSGFEPASKLYKNPALTRLCYRPMIAMAGFRGHLHWKPYPACLFQVSFGLHRKSLITSNAV